MKFCPTCQTRYDEEILRFCTKDGTLLIEETSPNFTALPSESIADEPDEETIVRRKPPVIPAAAAAAVPPAVSAEKPGPRIVIPTSEERPKQNVRTNQAAYQAPQQKQNTTKIVLLTILGTLVILAGAGGIFWMLQSDNSSNSNSNTNPVNENVNTNPPTNLGLDNSFNFNAGSGVNTNFNINTNANIKTPTPTPKQSPTPTPTPRPTPETNTNSAANTNSANPRETNPTPAATPTPRPTATAAPPANRPVNVGVLNSRALNLPTPAYPSSARSVGASGRVTVQVFVDENGSVSSAKAVSGHPLLRQAAEAAARQSRFNPIRVNNQAVPASGILVYNFIN